MGVQEIKFYEKYIGLPSLVGRGKKANFNYIKERVWKKLQWWERGSNECSGSSYSYLCHRMLQIPNRYFPWNWTLNKFWWGQRGDRRKINWLRWEEMTNSKSICGMGLRDLTMILYWPNKHEGCCMIGTPFSAKFSKQYFFPHCSIMEAKDSASAPMLGKAFHKKGMLYKKDLVGVLEMENLLRFGDIIVYQSITLLSLPLL